MFETHWVCLKGALNDEQKLVKNLIPSFLKIKLLVMKQDLITCDKYFQYLLILLYNWDTLIVDFALIDGIMLYF